MNSNSGHEPLWTAHDFLPSMPMIETSRELLYLMRHHDRAVLHQEDMIPGEVWFLKILPPEGSAEAVRFMGFVTKDDDAHSAWTLIQHVHEISETRACQFPIIEPEIAAAYAALPLNTGPWIGTFALPDSPLRREWQAARAKARR